MATTKTEAQRKEVVSGIQLSTVPAIAAIQKQANDYYVKNGTWSAALHDKAEAVRTSLNPMYSGSKDGSKESQYILPGSGGDSATLDGAGSLLDGLYSLFGSAAGQAGGAAKEAAQPSNNGTMFLVLGGLGLLLLLGKR